jgi:uncharacterized protein YqhQ
VGDDVIEYLLSTMDSAAFDEMLNSPKWAKYECLKGKVSLFSSSVVVFRQLNFSVDDARRACVGAESRQYWYERESETYCKC